MAIKPVEILIKARDEASGIFGSLQSKVAAVGVAIAGYFGVTSFIGAIRGAGELEAKLSEVKAVSGATAAEMAELRKAAEDAGAATKYTATEGAEALGNLTRAGLSAKDAIAALPAVLNLAQAGGIELGAASEYVTKAVQGMGLKFSDAGRVADVLAMGANASSTSVTGLAQALSYAAPVANSLGLSLESTVAIIGKFSDAGIDASRAGTALNAVLSQFADPASKFQEELANAGIVTNNFEVALRKLAAAGPAGNRAILAVGTEAGPALRALVNQGIGALDDLKGKLLDAAGSAAATAAVMEDNLPGAINSLSSAWDTVKNTLATPVLPILREGVTQLAESLRGAVSNGTIGKFGEALATAFQSGLTWAREFLGTVDFAALTQKMQDWADRAGETFAKVAEHASNAGNIVQTAYGVMSGGVNMVKAVIFTLAEAFAGVASNIQSGLAMLMEGLSKITFGGLSASFKAAAEEMRISAGATWAVSEAFAAKAQEAFDSAADGAEMARNGFKGLSTALSEADQQGAASERVMRSVASALKDVGTEAQGAGQKAQAGAAEQKEAADRARAAVAELKKAYEAAVAAGDWQQAAVKMQAIQQAYKATEEQVVRTREAIEMAGKAQQANFSLRQSGIQVAIEEQKAILEVARALGNEAAAIEAQRAIRQLEIELLRVTAEAKRAEAKAAIASAEALRAELTTRGQLTEVKRLEIDASIAAAKVKENEARIADLTANKLSNLAEISSRSGQAAADSRAGYESAAAGLNKMADASERAAAAERKRLNVDKDGFSLDKSGNRFTASAPTRRSVFEDAKGQGLGETQALSIAERFIDERGFAQGWQGFQSIGLAIQAAINKAILEQAAAGNRPGKSAAVSPEVSAAASKTVNFNLSLNGVRYGTVATDEAGSTSMESFLSALQQAQSRTG